MRAYLAKCNSLILKLPASLKPRFAAIVLLDVYDQAVAAAMNLFGPKFAKSLDPFVKQLALATL